MTVGEASRVAENGGPELIFRCPAEWRRLLPEPVPAREGLPDWLRHMPKEAASPLLPAAVRTVKQCPPFVDAMGQGWLMRLAADVTVEKGEVSWAWDLPPCRFERLQRAPIGLHLSAQATGSPLDQPGTAFIKFNNFWSVEAPAGISLLYCHPVNRPDLPFRTLTGLVDADGFTHGLTHFPARWTDGGFSGVLEKGTPVAQLIPVLRGIGARIESLEGDEADRFSETLDAIADSPGGYRKRFRASDR